MMVALFLIFEFFFWLGANPIRSSCIMTYILALQDMYFISDDHYFNLFLFFVFL